MPKLTITRPDGQILEISDLSLEEIKELANLNGHAVSKRSGARAQRSAGLPPKDTEPNYKGFYDALADNPKKFIAVLKQNPNGISADNLVEKMGLKNGNQIGGITGAGMARMAGNFSVNLKKVYLKERVFADGEGRTIYKPGKDIEKLQ
jgi:hypothetical protein